MADTQVLIPHLKKNSSHHFNHLKKYREMRPRFALYAPYLNGSFGHWTGERLLAGSEDSGVERWRFSTPSVPDLL